MAGARSKAAKGSPGSRICSQWLPGDLGIVQFPYTLMKYKSHSMKYVNDHTITFIVYLYRFGYKNYKKKKEPKIK